MDGSAHALSTKLPDVINVSHGISSKSQEMKCDMLVVTVVKGAGALLRQYQDFLL